MYFWSGSHCRQSGPMAEHSSGRGEGSCPGSTLRAPEASPADSHVPIDIPVVGFVDVPWKGSLVHHSASSAWVGGSGP